MEQFDIPVVLFLFRRSDTLPRIIGTIAKVKPQKLYLLCDQGRNEEERLQVELTRKTAESLITWPCELIKNYAENNRGVYGNIGLGAKWVFEREEYAIFLEDDNLPEESFFRFCRELLFRYKSNNQIMWICGTNYLGEYRNKREESYMFTRNLLPCGWASWSEKFLKYYDFGFESVKSEEEIKDIRGSYLTSRLYRQEQDSILSEYRQGKSKGKYRSWDYHMIFSIRKNNMLGISPAVNLIRNIGVDDISEHGGSNMKDVMTKRFCEIPICPIESSLKHPLSIEIDKDYEKKIEKVITKPYSQEISTKVAVLLRRLFKIPDGVSTKSFFINKRKS